MHPKQPKVLHLYKTYLPETIGGVEMVVNQIAKISPKLGINSEILTLTSQKKASVDWVDGHQVYRVPKLFELASTPISFRLISRFKKLLKEAEVIHYHFPWPLADLAHFMKEVKKPSVLTYHSDIVKQKVLLKLYYPLQMQFLKSVDSIVATSPNYLETSPVLQKFKDKVKVIPIGIDEADYPKARPATEKYWKDKIRKPFFLFIGVLRYYKGLHFLLTAAQKVNAPIFIIGTGPMEKKLKDQVKKLSLKNVYFLGKVSQEDKSTLLNLCYGVILPSHLRSEAFGVFLAEGAMFGKPMISAEIGTGTSFVNIDQETGIVVPPADPEKLAEAMTHLLKNPAEARRMGENARKRYEQKFKIKRMGILYIESYLNLI